MIHFIYYGEIRGKGRPRFRNLGKFVQTYTDRNTQDYEMSLKEAYLQANQPKYMNPDEALGLQMNVYMQMPKSATKKKHQEMLEGIIKPTKKPDIDNILKSVLDSLNQVAFYDDTQIISIKVNKYYAEEPRLEITIFSLEEAK